jgi:alpha-D-ribose 1-methylphosphonate 5-triphosphate synthase subunit PhnI
MYVAVKGGEKAINNAHQLLAQNRRGDSAVPELKIEQIQGQLFLAVDRVMAEGSIFDPELASLAIKQACGDMMEAIFLLRAYRTTLPRLGVSLPLETSALHIQRRISAIFKDLPGGQILGPTFDYTHRLLDFGLSQTCRDASEGPPAHEGLEPVPNNFPRAVEFLEKENLIQLENRGEEPVIPGDLTRQPLKFPAERDIRLQNLARGDEGFLLCLAYSSQRGFGKTHPFVGEIRVGSLLVTLIPEELGFPIEIGEISITECQMVNQFTGSSMAPPMFTQGYGLTFGQNEKKAMAMALVDRALRSRDLAETVDSPAQDEEFVLYHSDNVEASGFLQHLKLPHYVDFQAELTLIRNLQNQAKKKEAIQENGNSKRGTGIGENKPALHAEPAGI